MSTSPFTIFQYVTADNGVIHLSHPTITKTLCGRRVAGWPIGDETQNGAGANCLRCQQLLPKVAGPAFVRPSAGPPIMSVDIEGHGHYALRTWQFDQLITRYLPASVAALRADLNERGRLAGAGITYDDVTDVTSLLFILGEYDGMVS